MTPLLRKNLAKTATAAVLALAVTGLAPNHTFAQSGNIPAKTAEELLSFAQFLEDVGGAERIDYAGKLRMLSQRIPAAACNLNAGIAADASGPMLAASVAEFEKITNALEFGDADLNIIGVEERRKTLAAIADLHDKWAVIFDTVNEISATGPTDAAVQVLADANIPLLESAALLVSEVSGQYADPTAVLQADALRIDIAGRQRMLTQKISKEVCLISSGINAEASKEVLGGTINMFEVSLNALHHGMPEAGIGPAPNEEIAAQLMTVETDWNAIKPHLDTVMAGGSLDDATRGELFAGLNKTMVDMNIAVGMFTESSKLGL